VLDVIEGLFALGLVLGVLWVLWGVVMFVYSVTLVLYDRHVRGRIVKR
jgi:hypothetical protein